MTYKLQTVLLLVFTATIVGCGGGSYLNKDYQFHETTKLPDVAIIPFDSKFSAFVDSVFATLFIDFDSLENSLGPAELRERLGASEDTKALVNKLLSLAYTKERLSAPINLKDDLSPEEFSDLRSLIYPVKFLFVPSKFGIKSIGIATTGSLEIRLYDIASGELIYQKEQQLTVEQGGDDGWRSLLIGLVAFSRDDYGSIFVSKIKK